MLKTLGGDMKYGNEAALETPVRRQALANDEILYGNKVFKAIDFLTSETMLYCGFCTSK